MALAFLVFHLMSQPSRGLIQSLLRHPRMLLNPRYGSVGLVAFPFFFFFEMLGPLIEAFGYLFVALSFLLGFLELRFLLLFVTVSIFYGIFLSIAAVLLDEISFHAPERAGTSVSIDAAYVREKLGAILEDQDLSRYIL